MGVLPFKPELPATIGNEGAGIVLALGEGVTSVAVGDRVVLPLSETVKNYQQRLLAPAAELVVVPRDADPRQASMMAINPVTAALLLSEYVDLKPGDAVVFNSATSGLSQWLISLAKEKGLSTIGTVRRVEDVEMVKQRGCDHVIVDDEPLGAVMKELSGLNVRLGLDALGGPSAGRILQMLSRSGKLVIYGAVTLKPLELLGAAIMSKGLTVEGFFELSPEMKPKMIATLRSLHCNVRPWIDPGRHLPPRSGLRLSSWLGCSKRDVADHERSRGDTHGGLHDRRRFAGRRHLRARPHLQLPW